MRSLATLAIALAPIVAIGWGLSVAWLTRLDLSVTASCCSTTLDAARRDAVLFWQGPRALAVWGALGRIQCDVRHPGRRRVDLHATGRAARPGPAPERGHHEREHDEPSPHRKSAAPGERAA